MGDCCTICNFLIDLNVFKIYDKKYIAVLMEALSKPSQIFQKMRISLQI
jgi:hypothetical protein